MELNCFNLCGISGLIYNYFFSLPKKRSANSPKKTNKNIKKNNNSPTPA